MTNPKENVKTAAFVLGMHRSGTSCFARCLNILGYSIPKTLIGMDHTNKTGHWESYKIARLNDEILEKLGLTWSSWRSVDFNIVKHADLVNFKEDIKSIIKSEFGNSNNIVIKEPRICRTASAYIEALEQLNYTVKTFFVVRNPLEVIKSLEKRNGIGNADAALLWLRYNLDAEFASRKLKRAFISFPRLVESPIKTFELASSSLSLKYPQVLDDVSPMLIDFVSPSQINHSISNEEVSHASLTAGWIDDVYSALLVLCNNPNSKKPLEVLDRVRREFDISSPNLSKFAEFKEREYGEGLEKVNDELREEKELHTQVTASFSEQTDVITALKNEVRDLQKTLSESEINKSELTADYNKLEKELRAQVTTSVGEQAEVIATLKNEARDLQDALSESEANKNKLTADYNELESSIVEKNYSLDELEVELTRVHNALSLSESHIESLVSDLSELEEVSERKSSSLKRKLKAQKKKREKAKKVLNELQLKFDDVYSERTTLNQNLSVLETELDALKSDYEKRLKESQEAYEQVLGERGQLESTLAARGQEFISLKSESEDLRQALTVSKQETTDLQTNLVAAKQALTVSKQETTDAQASLIEASRNFKKIKYELREAGDELKALRRSKRGLQKDKWNLQDQVRVFNDRIEAYRDSTSWRVTKPIRVLKRALRSVKQKSFRSKIKSMPPLSVSHSVKNVTESGSDKTHENKIDVIRKSNLFDEEYYCTQYPIVKEYGSNPVEHYVTHGWKLGFQPNETFNSLAYIAANPIIKGTETCPLVHFIENNSDLVDEARNGSLDATANYGKIVVFTAVSGGYDELKPPLHVSGNADYVYFSEEENPDVTIWQYRPFDYFDVEPSRMSRFVKTHPHIYFEDYDWAIWIDANIQLNCKPEDLIRRHVNKNNLIMFSHPYRDCVYEEGQECIKRNKDTSELLSEQINRYKSLNFPSNAGLYETGVTISKPNDLEVKRLMNIWWREILMGSKRDQIALPFALKQANVKLGEISNQGICVRTDPRFVYFRHL